jgi:hypothetical protein
MLPLLPPYPSPLFIPLPFALRLDRLNGTNITAILVLSAPRADAMPGTTEQTVTAVARELLHSF